MHTIGERLEEARKRQGLSIREAAEATKIRSDFLLNMESNLFNFPLPDIYRRGFLRVYATYLKLDPEKLLTDYHAIQLGSSRARRGRGSYGTLETPEAQENAAPAATAVEADEDEAPAPDAQTEAPAAVDPHQYFKIGAVIVGTIVLLLLLIAGTRALFNSGDKADAPIPVEQQGPVVYNYVFTAKDDISSLTVTNEGKKLFSGPVRRGQKVPVSFEGEVELLCTQRENLVIESDGKTFGIPGTGIVRAYLPPRTKAP